MSSQHSAGCDLNTHTWHYTNAYTSLILVPSKVDDTDSANHGMTHFIWRTNATDDEWDNVVETSLQYQQLKEQTTGTYMQINAASLVAACDRINLTHGTNDLRRVPHRGDGCRPLRVWYFREIGPRDTDWILGMTGGDRQNPWWTPEESDDESSDDASDEE